mgnify:CR=1 FL=1
MTDSNQETEQEQTTVLVVDDEQGLADLYSLQLGQSHNTRTAYNGEEALEALDDDVDVILLDRRMPEMSGGEALATLRERGYDQPVAMLTAVDPGEEILELDIDEYYIKPISEEELQAAVDALLARSHYDAEFREYFAAISKKAAMETTMNDQELAASDAYATLQQEVEEAKDGADSALTEMMATDGFAGFREF